MVFMTDSGRYYQADQAKRPEDAKIEFPDEAMLAELGDIPATKEEYMEAYRRHKIEWPIIPDAHLTLPNPTQLISKARGK